MVAMDATVVAIQRRLDAGLPQPAVAERTEVTTPPKTPSKRPRMQSLHNPDGGGALMPYSVCELVTKTVWSHAQTQASKAAKDVVVEASSPSAASRKRSHVHEQPVHPATVSALTEAPRFFTGLCTEGGDFSQSQSQSQPCVGEEVGDVLQRMGLKDIPCSAEALARVRAMALAALAYWREVSTDLTRAAGSLARFLGHQRRLFWGRPPWRGVNLGGWLILEPGPSSYFWKLHGPATCEWDLMVRLREQLGEAGARATLQTHRETFITEDDFRRIRDAGFNAVRIPFGYWVVSGPANGEAYIGPCLEYLDRAVAWCKAYGLQAVLDLHGAPGGESGDRPCGRERREWNWQDWRIEKSIEVLKLLARRYCGHPSVTGISVCNEPSDRLPVEVLCDFYYRACNVIREAGMRPDEVAIVLPVYRTERLDEIWRHWNRQYDGFARHANVTFDLHLYHCFGPWWQRQSLGSHLKMTKRHRKILRRVPAVVGEWSLALPPAACSDDDDPKENDERLRAFATAQLEAYGHASHGWFFWNWRDSPQSLSWDAQRCIERNWLMKAQLAGTTAALA